MRVSEKTTENSERLGRQGQPGIEYGISHLSVLNAEHLSYCWGARRDSFDMHVLPGTFGTAVGFPNHYIDWSAQNRETWQQCKWYIYRSKRCEISEKDLLKFIFHYVFHDPFFFCLLMGGRTKQMTNRTYCCITGSAISTTCVRSLKKIPLKDLTQLCSILTFLFQSRYERQNETKDQ